MIKSELIGARNLLMRGGIAMSGHRGLKAELAIAATIGIVQACPKEFAAAVARRSTEGDWSKAAAEEFLVMFRHFKTEPDFPAPNESLANFPG